MNNDPSRSDYIRMISTHQGVLLGYILSMHPDRTEAQDILQETNIVVWEKIDQFQVGSNFKAWVFRIAYFQTLAYFKRKRRDHLLDFSSDLVAKLAEEAEPLMEDFESRQLALRRCLTKISDADRGILQSHYVDRKSVADVGREVERSAGAIKQVLLRLRRSLRECIDRQVNGAVHHA